MYTQTPQPVNVLPSLSLPLVNVLPSLSLPLLNYPFIFFA